MLSLNRILIDKKCRLSVDEAKLIDKINQVLARLGLNRGVELSVLLVGRKRALDLNKKYRKMTYIPQMLEFPMSKEPDADGWLRLGDIVICWELLIKDTKIFNKSVDDILDEWLVHGLGNLLK